MIAYPYRLYIRMTPFTTLVGAPRPARWAFRQEYRDVIQAREAVRSLRRYWPETATFITYPPVED